MDCLLTYLPRELQRMIIERCDFYSKRRLSATCYSLKQLVSDQPQHIRHVEIEELDDRIHVNVKFDDHEINLRFLENIEHGVHGTDVYRGRRQIGSHSDELFFNAAVYAIGGICLQKNTMIGTLSVRTDSDHMKITPIELERMYEKAGEKLKVAQFLWEKYAHPMIITYFLNGIHPEALRVLRLNAENSSDTLDLVPLEDKIVDLKTFECDHKVSAPDELLLKMRATELHLILEEKVSDDLISKLLERFKKLSRGYFSIKSRKEADYTKFAEGFQFCSDIQGCKFFASEDSQLTVGQYGVEFHRGASFRQTSTCVHSIKCYCVNARPIRVYEYADFEDLYDDIDDDDEESVDYDAGSAHDFDLDASDFDDFEEEDEYE